MANIQSSINQLIFQTGVISGLNKDKKKTESQIKMGEQKIELQKLKNQQARIQAKNMPNELEKLRLENKQMRLAMKATQQANDNIQARVAQKQNMRKRKEAK